MEKACSPAVMNGTDKKDAGQRGLFLRQEKAIAYFVGDF
jgi:hypothetical protein